MKSFDFIQSQINKKYDWFGIVFSQFLSLGEHNKRRWFCSEIVRKSLAYCPATDIEDDKNHHKYNPQDLLDEVLEKGATKWQL
jgi:hypothetical protein